jgi:hypothetical protein
MPRASAASLAVGPTVDLARVRLAPPAGLPELEAKGFAALVSALPPGHFRPEDTALICAFIRAGLIEAQAAAEVAAGNIERWAGVLADAQRALVALSTRLKIGPRSRGANTGRASRPQPRLSYYDEQRLRGET